MTLLLLFAAAYADAPLTLSYADALALAAAHNPQVVGAGLDLRNAEANLLGARAPFQPSLSSSLSTFSATNEGTSQFGEVYSDVGGWQAQASLSEGFATGTAVSLDLSSSQTSFLYRLKGLDQEFEEPAQFESTLGLTLSQNLLQGLKVSYNLQTLRGAQANLDVAGLQQKALVQSVKAEAAAAYWRALYTRRLVAIAAETERLQAEQLRVVMELVAAGRLPAVDRTRSEAAVAQAQSARLTAEASAAAATDALLQLLGEAPTRSVELSSTPAAPSPLPLDEAAVFAAVEAGNPGLAAQARALESARATSTAARNALLPELAASASGKLHGYEADLGAAWKEMASATLPEWSVGLSLSVPLGNATDRSRAELAVISAERAELALAEAKVDAEVKTRAQLRTLQTAAKQIELTQLNVRLARETLATEQARLAEGRALQKDVITAVNDLASAEVEAEKAVIDYQVAVVALQALKGEL